MSDEPSYWIRWCRKANEQTVLFTKQQLVFGLLLGLITNVAVWRFVPNAMTPATLLRILIIFVLSYLFAYAMSFVINLVHAPVSLESALQTQEQTIQDKTRGKKVQARFAVLMQEGEKLSVELMKNEFGPWLIERREWAKRVGQALVDIDLLTDAEAFRHSGELQPPYRGPGVVADTVYWRQFYGNGLKAYRDKLQEIVQRKLP
jgi:hypothetical protein